MKWTIGRNKLLLENFSFDYWKPGLDGGLVYVTKGAENFAEDSFRIAPECNPAEEVVLDESLEPAIDAEWKPDVDMPVVECIDGEASENGDIQRKEEYACSPQCQVSPEIVPGPAQEPALDLEFRPAPEYMPLPEQDVDSETSYTSLPEPDRKYPDAVVSSPRTAHALASSHHQESEIKGKESVPNVERQKSCIIS